MVDLEQQGYVRDPETFVWRSPDFSGIDYNDGDDSEQYVIDTLSRDVDLSSLSADLPKFAKDWPSRYHLAHERGNVLLPILADLAGKRVLEIGSGFGAVTRLLGERAESVLALEGTWRRATGTRLRTRDLHNVEVLASGLSDIPDLGDFDVVVVIGVLEYSGLFMPSDSRAKDFLSRCRELVSEEGILFLAIENQLGLKYWCGAPEDHLGVAGAGTQERYVTNGVQTFGRKALSALLRESGFQFNELSGSYPDYKFPSCMVTDLGAQTSATWVEDLVAQSVAKDPQLEAWLKPAVVRSSRPMVRNGLGVDLANSFVVVSSSQPIGSKDDDQILAYYVNSSRYEKYCKSLAFVQEANGQVVVRSGPLPALDRTNSSEPLAHSVMDSEPLYSGACLANRLVNLVTTDGWSLNDVAEFLAIYEVALIATADEPISDIFSSPDNSLPPSWLDRIPRNIMEDGSGGYSVIDQEWSASSEISAERLVFRALINVMGDVGVLAPDSDGKRHSFAAFVEETFRRLGWTRELNDLNDLIIEEFEFQAKVSPVPRGEVDSWRNSIFADPGLSPQDHLHQVLEEVSREGQAIAVSRDELLIQRDDLLLQRDKLAQAYANVDHDLAATQQVLRGVTQSKGWQLLEGARGVLGKRWSASNELLMLGAPAIDAPLREEYREDGPAGAFSTGTSVAEVSLNQYPNMAPLPVVYGGSEPTVTVVTDSLGSNSLFGGVATSLIIAALWAERADLGLRVVTRTEPGGQEGLARVLELSNIVLSRKPVFQFVANDGGEGPIRVNDGDRFLTTSWWSTYGALATLPSEKIVYLIQEDERQFYPSGDQRLLSGEVMNNPDITTLINTGSLHEHLIATGLPNLAMTGTSFEPSFKIFTHIPKEPNPDGKRHLFFYARPGHARNLFLKGIETLERAKQGGLLPPNEWVIDAVGSNMPDVRFCDGSRWVAHLSLDWERYRNLISRMDLGFSLMSAPHPSYPPLDLVSAGVPVVTNSWPGKPKFEEISKRFIVRDTEVDQLVDGIRSGVQLMGSTDRQPAQISEPYSNDWQTNLEEVVSKLSEVSDNG